MITPEQLESKAKAIKAKVDAADSLEVLADDEVFLLTAYEFWKDGQDWDQGIPEMAQGLDVVHNTRVSCLLSLKNIFAY